MPGESARLFRADAGRFLFAGARGVLKVLRLCFAREGLRRPTRKRSPSVGRKGASRKEF